MSFLQFPQTSLFLPSLEFYATAPFTPYPTLSRSPFATPSPSRAVERASLSVSEIPSFSHSVSVSVSQEVSTSVTVSLSQIFVLESTVVEGSELIATEVPVNSIVWGENGESSITQVASYTMIEVKTLIESQILIETVTAISSVVISLTFFQVEMPIFITVMSKMVFMVNVHTTYDDGQVSNAALIGAVGGGGLIVCLIVAAIMMVLRARKHRKRLSGADQTLVDGQIVGDTSERQKFRAVRRTKTLLDLESSDDDLDELSSRSVSDLCSDIFMPEIEDSDEDRGYLWE
jgi:hypothetical protein